MMDRVGNLVLDTLSRDARALLNVEQRYYPVSSVLIEPARAPQFIYFPCGGAVVSIVRAMEDGSTVEAGVVGNEGFFDHKTVITAPAPSGNSAIVQIDGVFASIPVDLLRQYFLDDEAFRATALQVTSAFLEQVTQNLVCNRLHTIEQRLSKWLLTVRDRAQTDSLRLTQEFLAHMLGIHRPGVSIAVSALQNDGLIQHGRNQITVRDPEGLVARACECSQPQHAAVDELRRSLRSVRQRTDIGSLH